MARSGLVRRRGEGRGSLVAVWIRASPAVSLRFAKGVSWCSRMWGYSLEIVLKSKLRWAGFRLCVKPSGHCFCAW